MIKKTKYMLDNKIKKNIPTIIFLLIFGLLFVYSTMHICTFIFGNERELHVETDNHYIYDPVKYYIYYNNGKKMVNKSIHISFLEHYQMSNNSDYIKFKQWGTFLTHRSAFIYSMIYEVIFIFFTYVYIRGVIEKKENNKTNKHFKQLSIK